MKNKPYQRKGSVSNAHVGRDFEEVARLFFSNIGIFLEKNVTINIGINGSRPRRFDLIDFEDRTLVVCKSYP